MKLKYPSILSGAASAVLLLLFWALPVSAVPGRLTIYTEHFPPYNYAQDGRVVGVNVKIVEQLCLRSGLHCDFELYPWLRAYALASKDSLGGLVSVSRTPEREQHFHWVGPLKSAQSYLYRLASRPDIRISSLEDAKAYTIAIGRGDVYERHLIDRGFSYDQNLVGFASKFDAMELFVKGKIDLIVGSEIVMPVWIERTGSAVGDVEPVIALHNVGGNYLALNRDIPASIVEGMRETLQQLHQSGKYQTLVERYYKPVNSGNEK
ncbi:ABC transporter substrate-binding protein [Lacimicrobium sp. SS2-24]|uniref:substrate-binding periplasmic protein n=1 Tax=Lacimicrobium sp. SS2-24 TaxID=2005569 RepID=UPI00143AF195|nr:ABC transporter substrate-binding protein [Lacimicrobium sp. SS2-24]